VADRVGQQLGNYHLIRMLGQGTFADVYLGQHVHLNTQAAVKLLHERLEIADVESFLSEARTIAHLRHPHIVRVLDFGVEETTPFLVMDYAPNGTLRQRHPQGTVVPLDTVVSYVNQLASALQYAHDTHLIHRDIKPENMLLEDTHEIVLTDFGIAILAHHSGSQQGQDAAGTIAYMAPEQMQAHAVTASDQYALGIVVYEWLCGDRPFHGSFPEIALKHSLVPPPSLLERVPTIPPAVEQVVFRALAKDPKHRFASVQDFAVALEVASKAESPGIMHLTDTPKQIAEAEQRNPAFRFNNLPVQLTSLIGREQEVTEVSALLQRPDVRLVTLTGMGGIGKTRLGLQVATELFVTFADGIFFVSLASVSDPPSVIGTIAHLLGLEHQHIGQRFPTEHMEYLKAFLQDKHLLLLLDNFEQVVAAAPDLTELLKACPHLKILVTSRAVLHIQGEYEFAVPPLALPKRTQLSPNEDLSQYAAVALFLERALAIKPDLPDTTANMQAIAAICVHLDGLPLAIELAAARIKLFPPRALLQRMTHRLDVLTGGVQGIPARQQALRNTIAWSYNLLDATEQRLFRRLSVFVGSYTLEAVEFLDGAVADGAGQVLDGVASLIDKSLLLQIEQEGDEPRLVMLETIREFGLEALTASGEEEMTRQAHLAYYVALAEKAEPELLGPQQAAWLQRLEREHDNLNAALQWSVARGKTTHDMTMALRLGVALRRFWTVRGPYSEGRNFLERALAASEGVTAPVRAKAFYTAANLAFIQSDYERAEEFCQESLKLFRELGDRPGIAYALYLLAWVGRDDINIDVALVEEALALFREIGDREFVAWSFYTLAYLDSLRGEYVRACTLMEESLARHKELGNKRGIAFSLIHLAEIHFVSQHDQATMPALLAESLTLFTELDDKDGLALSGSLRGQIALSQGDAALARSLLEESLMLYRVMGSRQGIAQSLCQLARAATTLGDNVTAYTLYEEGLSIAREMNRKRLIASYLEGLAELVTAEGKYVWAAQLWGAAEVLREAVSVPIPFFDRASYDRAVADVRSQLGEQLFAAAWAQGGTMAPEQAFTLQERELPSLSPTILTAPSPTYPAGLTAREVEVLRLVARGLTNSEIAQQLGLSEKTIAHHLTHIFNKTTSENRASAAAFAIRHGLA